MKKNEAAIIAAQDVIYNMVPASAGVDRWAIAEAIVERVAPILTVETLALVASRIDDLPPVLKSNAGPLVYRRDAARLARG